jgi:hypothetical protein
MSDKPVHSITSTYSAALFCVLMLPAFGGLAAMSTAKAQRHTVENEYFRLRLVPRTPSQIAAFYEARGFPASAINQLRKACFITVSLRNKSRDIVWLEQARWKFSTPHETLTPLSRKHWQETWEALDVPRAQRATFRWTLLPEELNFLPDEAEGGNIILPRVDTPITLQAQFATRADRSGPTVSITVSNLYCATD